MFTEFNLSTLANFVSTIDGAISIITAIVASARALRALARRIRRRRAGRRQLTRQRRRNGWLHGRKVRFDVDAIHARIRAFWGKFQRELNLTWASPSPEMRFS